MLFLKLFLVCPSLYFNTIATYFGLCLATTKRGFVQSLKYLNTACMKLPPFWMEDENQLFSRTPLIIIEYFTSLYERKNISSGVTRIL